jgi:hypothetical protein
MLDGNPEPDLVHATGCKQPTLRLNGADEDIWLAYNHAHSHIKQLITIQTIEYICIDMKMHQLFLRSH